MNLALTEEAKLKKRYEINKLLSSQISPLSNDNRNIALQLAEKQYKDELSYILLAKEQRIFAAQESMMTEMEA